MLVGDFAPWLENHCGNEDGKHRHPSQDTPHDFDAIATGCD
jgi:hypothetical protein